MVELNTLNNASEFAAPEATKTNPDSGSESPVTNTNTDTINTLIENLNNLKERVNEGKVDDIDEGLFGALVGGAAGLTVLPTIMKGLCAALGVTDKGPLGTLLTSRLVLTAICGKIGWSL